MALMLDPVLELCDYENMLKDVADIKAKCAALRRALDLLESTADDLGQSVAATIARLSGNDSTPVVPLDGNTRDLILSMMSTDRDTSPVQIVEAIGRKMNAVTNQLARLVQEGVVVKIGKGAYRRAKKKT